MTFIGTKTLKASPLYVVQKKLPSKTLKAGQAIISDKKFFNAPASDVNFFQHCFNQFPSQKLIKRSREI